MSDGRRIEYHSWVDGIDIMFVGPRDLSWSYGDPGGAKDEVRCAIQRVAAAAKRYGKHWGLPAQSASIAEPFVEMGARFFCCGSVMGLVSSGLKAIVSDFSTLSPPRQKLGDDSGKDRSPEQTYSLRKP